MTTNPYAEIRRTLVQGVRNSDRPATVKHHAEVLIAAIDNAQKDDSEESRQAVLGCYARFMRVAEDARHQ